MSDPLPSAGQKRSAPDSDADAESLNGDTEWVEETGRLACTMYYYCLVRIREVDYVLTVRYKRMANA